MKIAPRNKSDRGGYLIMPLKQNIPNPKDKTAIFNRFVREAYTVIKAHCR